MFGLSRTYGGALPDAGGLLDQSVSLLRTHAILQQGGHFEAQDGSAGGSIAPLDALAGIPMVPL